MLNLMLATSGAATNNAQNSWWIYLVLIGLVIVMLVFPMFTQKKRNKEFNSMLDQMKVGDKVRTIGGVIGRVTKINRDADIPTVVIETGAKNAKTTMEFDVTAIGYNFNYNPQAAAMAEKAKKEAAKAEAKEEVKEEAKAEETTPEVKAEEAKAEEKKEEKKETKKAPAKKTAAKKTTTKKTTKK